jgi:hypothetical protein
MGTVIGVVQIWNRWSDGVGVLGTGRHEAKNDGVTASLDTESG